MNISEVQKMVESGGIVFLTYGGFLSQALVSSMTEALEHEIESRNINMGISNNIFTIFIELSQNMMHYSKSVEMSDGSAEPKGLIFVSKDKQGNYYVDSQNVVSIEDREKLETKLIEIKGLDRDGVKKRYRELRKSGKNAHGRGGGIGFYEIAKRCDRIEYEFTEITDTRFYFHVRTFIKGRKDK